MGVKILLLRHREAPAPESCRWCGFPERGHDMVHTPSAGWHGYTPPTPAQIHARMTAKLSRTPYVVSLPGPHHEES